jgi:hypothetical protein
MMILGRSLGGNLLVSPNIRELFQTYSGIYLHPSVAGLGYILTPNEYSSMMLISTRNIDP